MRAYMSDLEARYVRRMGAREVYLPADAEREARRILVETEQGDRGDVEHARIADVRYFRHRAKKDAETRSLFAAQSTAHVALAEALDMLCDAPDTAAWLAFVQRNPERAL